MCHGVIPKITLAVFFETLCIFKQSVHNVSADQLQQPQTIEICCKMMQLPYQLTHEANHSVSSRKRS